MRVLLLTIVLAAAACSDPTISVEIVDRDPKITQHPPPEAPPLTVSVIDAASAGHALGDGHVATCDEVAFGLIAPDVLEGARRASVSADASSQITGVPRLGEKLVVVEGKLGGRRVLAGCEPLHAIEQDTTVTVGVFIAPRLQQIGRMNADNPHDVVVVAAAPWDDEVRVAAIEGDHNVRFEQYSAGTPEDPVEASTGVNGAVAITGFGNTAGQGPVQTVVRVKWAEEPIRIAGFKGWTAIDSAGGPPIRFPSGTGLGVTWTTGFIDTPLGVRWAAAALHRNLAGGEEVIAVILNAGKLEPHVVATPGVGAILIYDQKVWAVLDDGWYQLGLAGVPATPTYDDAGGRAEELVYVKACNAGEPTGILVRRAAGDGLYDAYADPQTPLASGVLADLVTEIGSDKVLGQLCATGPDVMGRTPIERLVLVTNGNGLRAIRIREGVVLADHKLFLPLTPALTDFPTGTGGVRRIGGATAGLTGPRVQSFRFGELVLGAAGTIDAAVATSELDQPITTMPTSILIKDLDADGGPDVLALLPAGNGLRIQVVMALPAGGQPLSGVTDPIVTDRTALQSGRMQFEQIDRGTDAADGCLELVVMSDVGLDVFKDRFGDANADQCAR